MLNIKQTVFFISCLAASVIGHTNQASAAGGEMIGIRCHGRVDGEYRQIRFFPRATSGRVEVAAQIVNELKGPRYLVVRGVNDSVRSIYQFETASDFENIRSIRFTDFMQGASVVTPQVDCTLQIDLINGSSMGLCIREEGGEKSPMNLSCAIER